MESLGAITHWLFILEASTLYHQVNWTMESAELWSQIWHVHSFTHPHTHLPIVVLSQLSYLCTKNLQAIQYWIIIEEPEFSSHNNDNDRYSNPNSNNIANWLSAYYVSGTVLSIYLAYLFELLPWFYIKYFDCISLMRKSKPKVVNELTQVTQLISDRTLFSSGGHQTGMCHIKVFRH